MEKISKIFLFLAVFVLSVFCASAYTIDSVVVTPASPNTTNDLHCQWKITGDNASYTVNVTWLNNSVTYSGDDENGIVTQNNTVTGTTATGDVEAADTTKGEKWKCRISATDTVTTKTQDSSEVTILNSAPVITSTAVTSVGKNQAYSYDVDATDADGDALTYSLVNGYYPSGMTIDANIGVISWSAPNTTTSYNIKVRASDTGYGASYSEQSYTLSVTNVTWLAIEDIEGWDDGSKENDIDVDGGTFDEVKPGTSIKVKVNVQNTWPEGTENHEISSLSVEAVLEGMGEDDDDQELDEELNDLKPWKDHDATFEFDIPIDAEDGNYDLTLTIKGKDQDGTRYLITKTLGVNVEKESHYLYVTANPNPSTIGCNRYLQLATKVKNIGENDENDIKLEITQPELGIESADFFSLQEGDYDDEDTEFSKTYSYKISDKVKPGPYTIEVVANYFRNRDRELVSVPINVVECVEDEETPTTPVTPTTPTQPTTPGATTGEVNVINQPGTQTPVAPPTTASTPKTVKSESFLDSNFYIVMLVLGIVVVAIFCVVLLGMLFKRN